MMVIFTLLLVMVFTESNFGKCGLNTPSHIPDTLSHFCIVTFAREHVGKDFIIYMVEFLDMTEKEGPQQGAFWDLSNTTGAEPDAAISNSDNAIKGFQPHEPRERIRKVIFFDVIFHLGMAAFFSLFLVSVVEDTWHITPWECSEEVVEADDGTFQCQQNGITETREYDSSGFEIIEPTEKVIAVAMYMLLVFILIVYCWAKLSKKDHLRHLGEENVVVLMTSRFGMTPKIKERILLQNDSFIQRTTGQYRSDEGTTKNYVTYKIHSEGQKPFTLSKFEERDYTYVTGLQIQRE